MKIYEVTTRNYERNTPRGKWHETECRTQFITQEFHDAKLSDGERAFWRAIDAPMRVSVNPYSTHGAIVTAQSIRPDKLAKWVDVHTPCSLYDAMVSAGWREREAMRRAEDQRIIPVVHEDGNHRVIRLGDDEVHADYDLISRKWVG